MIKKRKGIIYETKYDETVEFVSCKDVVEWVVIVHPENAPLMVNVKTGSIKRLGIEEEGQ